MYLVYPKFLNASYIRPEVRNPSVERNILISVQFGDYSSNLAHPGEVVD